MTVDKTVTTMALTKGAKCPTCGKPSTMKYRPFCSKRCADIDLGQWLNEGYKIESDEESDFDEYEPG
ncbi:DNA gyrase inhibitor YacG [Terasakiella sp. A23]|uniref:DNA gyrase inhibitor YacG n=1 Tax=Terasakiella sp. FCG-A23 TaxID=3080561 RepID=UPI0029549EF1|nr:DNA gyrase inhibitor YacG [Terasakiella sp. A23]MDV7341335.1 DNA gyrase inhibitor YacG [Terasakiella sp. A23]